MVRVLSCTVEIFRQSLSPGRAVSNYLNTETTVDLGNVVVILPDDAELENTLRDLNNVEGLLVLGVCVQEGLE